MLAGLLGLLLFTSCTSRHMSMREPNSRVEFEREDFTLSDQVSGEASRTQILLIDWSRLFGADAGSVSRDVPGPALPTVDIASIPVIGSLIGDPTANYALYDMMQKNPGFDVVFYPQYATTVERPIGLGFIFKMTSVKVDARLGKIK